MRSYLLVVAAALAVCASVSQSVASIQPAMICVEPDIEFPVPCDDGD